MTVINEKYLNILREFIPDFLNEFPQYTNTLHPTIKMICDHSNNTFNEEDTKRITELYKHSFEKLWENYTAILYDDHSIFDVNNVKKLEFIQGIDFYHVWNLPTTSEQTKTILSKYLKMFIISILSYESNEEKIGNSTVEILEKLNETNIKTKLSETLEELNSFFAENHSVANDIPKVESLFETLENVSKGKIGQLAKEIADETFKDMEFNDDSSANNMEDIFKTMFNNPQKLMKMTKSISDKLDSKMKSGELKDSDLMQEASNIMSQMKNIPGFTDMSKIFGLQKKTMRKNMPTPADSSEGSNIEKFWNTQSKMKGKNAQKSSRVNNKKKKNKK